MLNDAQWILQQWQEVLRLEDWEIKVQMLSRADFNEKTQLKVHAYGHNLYYKYYQTSYITICDDSPDKEYTLVHELVHLIVDKLDSVLDQSITMAPGEPAQQLLKGSQEHWLEVTVNQLTQAFLKTRRFAYEQGCNNSHNN